jgi:hypothetical protein
VLGCVVVPLLVEQLEPDLPHRALCTLVQDDTAIMHVMQAVNVAAAPTHKFEVEDVALGLMGLIGLVVGNPLRNRQGVFSGLHAGSL